MTIKYLRNLSSTSGTSTGGTTTADFQQVLKANFTNNVSATVGVSRYYPPAQMNISQIYASVGTVSASPITVDIKVNGTSVLGTNLLTIPANQFISTKRTVTLSVLSTSYITVDVVTGGGTDLIVYMVYRFAEAAAPTPSPNPGSSAISI